MSEKIDADKLRKGSYQTSRKYEQLEHPSHRRDRSRSRSKSSSDSSSADERDNNSSDHGRKRHYTKYVDSAGVRDDDDRRDKSRRPQYSSKLDKRAENVANDELLPPPPPRISKISLAFGGSGKVLPVQMKLAPPKAVEVPKKIAVASAFINDSDDDEPEEMPAECRMRMRNIGRDTPTSSGPNSFGKTKHGFCDAKKIFEKNMRDDYNDD